MRPLIEKLKLLRFFTDNKHLVDFMEVEMRFLASVFLTGFIFVLASFSVASSPSTKIQFPLVKDAGTWLICCASYSGVDAPELSRQVVEILRTRDNLEAYIFNHGEEERKKQAVEFERRQKLSPELRMPKKFTRISEQCAVLIGGYKDIEDARKNLEKVKKLPPPQLKLESGKETADVINIYVPLPDKKGAEIRRERLNPLSTAFVVRNPLIPQDNIANNKPDPILKTLNADESFSLLKNSKSVTLVVKEYNGSALLQSTKTVPTSFIEKFFGSRQGDLLNAAALQAHETARVLRRLEFDAYVLHTRTSSIVTIGGFDSLSDPNIVKVQKAITSLKISALDLYSKPLPMEIPKL